MIDAKTLLKKLGTVKYPLLVLAFGVLLLLLPMGTGAPSPPEEGAGTALEELLRRSDGVGEIRILISESGVIAVCEGAENPRARLDILRAIGSYTGFGSDKITILKLVK